MVLLSAAKKKERQKQEVSIMAMHTTIIGACGTLGAVDCLAATVAFASAGHVIAACTGLIATAIFAMGTVRTVRSDSHFTK